MSFMNKQCTKCKEEKPATFEHFPSRYGKEGAFASWCRACLREYHKNRRQTNGEAIREQERRRRAADPHRYLRWKIARPDYAREQSRKRRARNPEREREYKRQWREKNPTKQRASENRWKATHPKKLLDYGRAWRERNKEHSLKLNRAHLAVSYALKRGKIIRPLSCSRCKKEVFVHAHHYLGYEPEHKLDVQWLCDPCHKKIHVKENNDAPGLD